MEKISNVKNHYINSNKTKTLRVLNMIITEEYKMILADLENKEPLFVTGKAGTGKSTLISHIVGSTSKNVVVLAPTGVSALNVNGQTIHSFFQIPPKIIEPNQIKRIKNGVIKKVDLLIIDEISMVRADLMDTIDMSLRINTGNNELYGGIKLLMFGDLFQLPPVVTNKEKAYINSKYRSPYFLSADCFKKKPRVIELTKVFRQSDKKFIVLLSNIRIGKNLKETLLIINSNKDYNNDLQNAIMLTPTKRRAEEINMVEMSKIKSKEMLFYGRIAGKFNIQEEKLPSPFVLKLKEGATVMFTKNNGIHWVNGTIGIVKKINGNDIIVDIKGKEHLVKKVSWEMIRYKLKGKEISSEVIGSYIQYPLILSWALTIHKSQGKTYERIVLDIDNGAFVEGQVYVALSRCKTFCGICLKKDLIESDIIINPMVQFFYKNIDKYSLNKKTKTIKNDAVSFPHKKELEKKIPEEYKYSRVDEVLNKLKQTILNS